MNNILPIYELIETNELVKVIVNIITDLDTTIKIYKRQIDELQVENDTLKNMISNSNVTYYAPDSMSGVSGKKRRREN